MVTRMSWAVAAALGISATAFAEPTPAGRCLMNTPASCFDFGMSQLRCAFYNIVHV
jgi:hypothetical protein